MDPGPEPKAEIHTSEMWKVQRKRRMSRTCGGPGQTHRLPPVQRRSIERSPCCLQSAEETQACHHRLIGSIAFAVLCIRPRNDFEVRVEIGSPDDDDLTS